MATLIRCCRCLAVFPVDGEPEPTVESFRTHRCFAAPKVPKR